MLYLETLETVKVTVPATNQVTKVDIDVGFEVFCDRYLVGFSKLLYAYPDTDHHVKQISLNLEAGAHGNVITIYVSGKMFDGSGNVAPVTVDLSVFAFSKEEKLTATTITAITGFMLGYNDTDHHLKGWCVNPSDLYDSSKHVADTNTLTTKTIYLPEFQGAPSINQTDVAKNVVFISEFAVVKAGDDCHVSKIGLQASPATFTFEDKDGQKELSIDTHAYWTGLSLNQTSNELGLLKALFGGT